MTEFKRNQESRAAFQLMNQNNHKTTQNWFTKTNESEFKSPFMETEQYIIHSKQASLMVWHQTSEQRRLYAKELQHQMSTNKLRSPKQNLSVNGLQQVITPNSTKSQQLYHKVTQINPKVKRLLCERSKHNFLSFLLAQKIGQKDEKLFNEFVKKTYNVEPPRQDGEPEKISKKGIKYLMTRDETAEQLQQQAKILISNPKVHYGRDVPLDRYLANLHESQLNRFPKLKSKMDQLQ